MSYSPCWYDVVTKWLHPPFNDQTPRQRFHRWRIKWRHRKNQTVREKYFSWDIGLHRCGKPHWIERCFPKAISLETIKSGGKYFPVGMHQRKERNTPSCNAIPLLPRYRIPLILSWNSISWEWDIPGVAGYWKKPDRTEKHLFQDNGRLGFR